MATPIPFVKISQAGGQDASTMNTDGSTAEKQARNRLCSVGIPIEYVEKERFSCSELFLSSALNLRFL